MFGIICLIVYNSFYFWIIYWLVNIFFCYAVEFPKKPNNDGWEIMKLWTDSKINNGEVMMQRTSIRFLKDIPVRAVWNEGSSKWCFALRNRGDVGQKLESAFVLDQDKNRKNELSTNCRQLKIKSEWRPVLEKALHKVVDFMQGSFYIYCHKEWGADLELAPGNVKTN